MMGRDFISKEVVEVITFKLFEEPIISEMLGAKGVCITLAMPTNEACSHVRSLYVTTKFNGQLIFRVLIDDGAMLNILPASMLRKMGKQKFDVLPTNFIMTNFCGTIAQTSKVISIELTVG